MHLKPASTGATVNPFFTSLPARRRSTGTSTPLARLTVSPGQSPSLRRGFWIAYTVGHMQIKLAPSEQQVTGLPEAFGHMPVKDPYQQVRIDCSELTMSRRSRKPEFKESQVLVAKKILQEEPMTSHRGTDVAHIHVGQIDSKNAQKFVAAVARARHPLFNVLGQQAPNCSAFAARVLEGWGLSMPRNAYSSAGRYVPVVEVADAMREAVAASGENPDKPHPHDRGDQNQGSSTPTSAPRRRTEETRGIPVQYMDASDVTDHES